MRVLVLIDFQRVFADPTSPWFVPACEEALEKCHRIASDYDSVLATRFFPPKIVEGSWETYYREFEFALNDEQQFELLRLPDCAQLTTPSHRMSKMECLKPYLQPGDEVFLAGVALECCLLATAIQLADEGFHVRILRDCSAGVGNEQAALAVLSGFAPTIQIL